MIDDLEVILYDIGLVSHAFVIDPLMDAVGDGVEAVADFVKDEIGDTFLDTAMGYDVRNDNQWFEFWKPGAKK